MTDTVNDSPNPGPDDPATPKPGRFLFDPPGPRYCVCAEFNGVRVIYWGADTMGMALKLILHALNNGATYAYQNDMRPDEPKPVEEVERQRILSLMPRSGTMC